MGGQTQVFDECLQQVLAEVEKLLEDAVTELEVLVGPWQRQLADEGFLVVLRLLLNRRKLVLDHPVQLVALVELLLLLVELGNRELDVPGGVRGRLGLS